MRKDPIRGKKKPNAILNEDTFYLDIDADVCSKIRNPRRLNARFKPRP